MSFFLLSLYLLICGAFCKVANSFFISSLRFVSIFISWAFWFSSNRFKTSLKSFFSCFLFVFVFIELSTEEFLFFFGWLFNFVWFFCSNCLGWFFVSINFGWFFNFFCFNFWILSFSFSFCFNAAWFKIFFFIILDKSPKGSLSSIIMLFSSVFSCVKFTILFFVSSDISISLRE